MRFLALGNGVEQKQRCVLLNRQVGILSDEQSMMPLAYLISGPLAD